MAQTCSRCGRRWSETVDRCPTCGLTHKQLSRSNAILERDDDDDVLGVAMDAVADAIVADLFGSDSGSEDFSGGGGDFGGGGADTSW